MMSTPPECAAEQKERKLVSLPQGHSPPGCFRGVEEDMQALLTSMTSIDVLNQMSTMGVEGMGLQLICKHTLAWHQSKAALGHSRVRMPRNSSCPKLVSLQ
jgi:hypothetical protein